MSDKPFKPWTAGERFVYIATGNAGVVLEVNTLAGTVKVQYDSRIGISPPTHVLAWTLLRRETEEKDSLFYARDIRNATSYDEYSHTQQFVDNQAIAARDIEDRKRLLNELYHDRARLERVVADAVLLAETALDLIEEGRDDSEYVSGLLQQFVDTHAGP